MKPLADYLYVATDGKHFKIGITCNPEQRMLDIRATMIKLYHRPYARECEAYVKNSLGDPVRGEEWFAVTEAEILREARKAVRVLDDDAAIKRGREPSKRPGPNDPPYEPPFELDWLEVA